MPFATRKIHFQIHSVNNVFSLCVDNSYNRMKNKKKSPVFLLLHFLCVYFKGWLFFFSCRVKPQNRLSRDKYDAGRYLLTVEIKCSVDLENACVCARDQKTEIGWNKIAGKCDTGHNETVAFKNLILIYVT